MANRHYAAPEQRAGGDVTEASDVFAMGYILSELFTGVRPEGEGYKNIGDEFQNFSFLDRVVELMIANRADERPTSSDVLTLIHSQLDEIEDRRQQQQIKQMLESAEETDDPLILDPPELVDIKFTPTGIQFVLSKKVNDEWYHCFRDPDYGGIVRYPKTDFGVGYAASSFHVELPSRDKIVKETDTQDQKIIGKIVQDVFPKYLHDANQAYQSLASVNKQKEIDKLKQEAEEQKRLDALSAQFSPATNS